ncbi:hypothetical protein ACWDBD_31470 [Streptomyces sp. NPDC001118]|uniref:hypothetical protein n=1 Tax=unclassified Streptomyces TaxID=2593676 RepID=UPI0033180647
MRRSAGGRFAEVLGELEQGGRRVRDGCPGAVVERGRRVVDTAFVGGGPGGELLAPGVGEGDDGGPAVG